MRNCDRYIGNKKQHGNTSQTYNIQQLQTYNIRQLQTTTNIHTNKHTTTKNNLPNNTHNNNYILLQGNIVAKGPIHTEAEMKQNIKREERDQTFSVARNSTQKIIQICVFP